MMIKASENYIQPYRGFINGSKAKIMGHVLRGDPKKEQELNRSTFRHAHQVIKLFFRKPNEQVIPLTVEFRGKKQIIETDATGFYKSDIHVPDDLEPGWHKYLIYFTEEEKITGVMLKPCDTDLGIISDIDDTYLISHSSNALKKLGVMLFRNVTKRKPFRDAVKHYQYLSELDTKNGEKNVFFNVSSSEWNLYPLLTEFLSFNDFPNAVLLLDDLKSGIRDLLSSGRGSHNHKLHKIESILNFYPERKFVLVGDDTQRDPYIYHQIVEQFPDRINFVQIRQVGEEKKPAVTGLLETFSVNNHYFETSEEAIDRMEQLLHQTDTIQIINKEK